MKPIQLTISAFGPFKDRQVIDFTQIQESDIYLIYGETGAGKTTIFDGISYALYGQTSGDERTGNMLRSDFSKSTDKTFVELIFTYHNQIYKIIRNPEYERAKTRGTGNTKEVASAELILPDGTVVSGQNEVNKKVTFILGIDKEQFSQIVMIAQGDFRKFLVSKTKERGAILRRIFETQNIEQMQLKLKQKKNVLKRELDNNKQSFIQYVSGILSEGDSNLNNLIEIMSTEGESHRGKELITLLTLLIKKEKEEIELQKSELADLHEKKERLTKETALILEQNKQIKKRMEKEKQLHELEEKKEAFIDKQKCIANGKKAIYKVLPISKQYERALKNDEEINIKINQAKLQIKKLENERAMRRDALFAEEKKLASCNQLQVKMQRIIEEMPKYDMLEESKNRYINALKEKEATQDIINSLIKKNEKIQKEIRMKSNILVDFGDLEMIHSKLILQNNLLQDKVDKTKQLIEQQHLLLLQEKKIQRLKKEFLMNEEEYKKRERLMIDMEESFYLEQAGLLAEKLTVNVPCPVCGSLKHPNPAKKVSHAPTKEELMDYRHRMDQVRKKRETSSLECSRENLIYETRKEQHEKELKLFCEGSKELHKIELSTLMEKTIEESVKVDDEIDAVKINIKNKKNLESAVKELQNKTEKFENLLLVNHEKLAAITDEMNRFKVEYEVYKKQVQFDGKHQAEIELEKISSIISKTKQAYETAKSLYENTEKDKQNKTTILEQWKLQKSEQTTETKELEKAYFNVIEDEGFLDEEEYTKALMSEKDIDDLEKEVQEFFQIIETINSEINILAEETKGKEYTDFHAFKLQQQILNESISLINETIQKRMSNYSSNTITLKNLKHALKKSEEKEHEYLIYKSLSDTANGEISQKERISFETYLQINYFQNILRCANLRLSVMSNQRYEMRRREETSSLKSQSGLEIDVLDHYTGKLRDVRSLSGGESFLTSLSLALGLSDIVQQTTGGIELNAMFIDEGFGTLDSETLDTAINSLQNMAGSGKTIGIISHVSELRDRIEKQIYIHKGTDGSQIENFL